MWAVNWRRAGGKRPSPLPPFHPATSMLILHARLRTTEEEEEEPLVQSRPEELNPWRGEGAEWGGRSVSGSRRGGCGRGSGGGGGGGGGAVSVAELAKQVTLLHSFPAVSHGGDKRN